MPNCLPFSRARAKNCEVARGKVIEFFNNNKSIDTVIFTGFFSFLEAGFTHGGPFEGARVAGDLNDDDRRAFQASADKMLSHLTSLNKKVVIFADIPNLIFLPRVCVKIKEPLAAYVRGSDNGKTIDQCGVPFHEFVARMKPYDDVLMDVVSRYPAVSIFDPRPVLCDNTFL